MMEDKDLNHMLNQYRVPALDPDLVIQAVHNAINAPTPQKQPPRKRSFGLLLNPFPSFVMGGMVAVAAMVLFVLPVLGLQISHEFNVDKALSDLTSTEQLAENDVQSADQIFSMLETPQQDDGQQTEDTQQDQSEDSPIWDTFMGRT